MKFLRFKFWQVLALISGSIVAVVMALASISYNATLGTEEAAFNLLPLSNRSVFEGLALAFDLGMVASVFGFWHWLRSNHVAAFFSAVLFVIASLFSVHSVRGYIALNLTKTLAPMQRNEDVYASLKLELANAQAHLVELRSSLLKARGRERNKIDTDIVRQVELVRDARARLAGSKLFAHVSPLKGLEWFVAATLWFFNATCWTAWFGSNIQAKQASATIEHGAPLRARDHERDAVRDWLATYQQEQPEHCARLYARFTTWCSEHAHEPVAERKFYERLIALDARKFRDGRNGPMLYALPHVASENDRLEA